MNFRRERCVLTPHRTNSRPCKPPPPSLYCSQGDCKMFRRKKTITVYLTDAQIRTIRDCLLARRNELLAEGRYADAVNEALLKFL